jgi:hypothetical protein
MNKRIEAMDKARQWRQQRKGDYIEKLDSSGKVFERTYSPQKQQPQARPRVPNVNPLPQARPRVPNVNPLPQQQRQQPASQPAYTPTGEQQWIMQQNEQSRLRQEESQRRWYQQMNQDAIKSQQRNQEFNLRLQQGINSTNLGVEKTRGEFATKGNLISTEGVKYRADQDRLSSFEQTRGGIEQSRLGADANKFVATESGNASRDVAKTQASSNNYQSDNQFKGIQYQANAQLEGLNKQTDANFFIEREKNANQKEKNTQDLWLNTGLGILDSINKQRVASSQAAAQIYSSYLSSNPYNFKYWN